MPNQIRSFVLHLATKVNVYQVMTLGLVLGAAIIRIQIGGGGGA